MEKGDTRTFVASKRFCKRCDQVTEHVMVRGDNCVAYICAKCRRDYERGQT